MRKVSERIMAVMLTLAMVLGGLVTYGYSCRADADAGKYVKYKKKITLTTLDSLIDLDMGKRVKSKDKVKTSSSNKSVVKPDGDLYFKIRKAGTAKLTITVKKKNGSVKKYKCTVKVNKYVNPIKSIKIGSRDLTSKFKKYNFASYTPKESDVQFSITPKKGWEIKKIKYVGVRYNSDYDELERLSNTVINNSRITVQTEKGWEQSFYITMYNQSKKVKLVITLDAFTEEPDDEEEDGFVKSKIKDEDDALDYADDFLEMMTEYDPDVQCLDYNGKTDEGFIVEVYKDDDFEDLLCTWLIRFDGTILDKDTGEILFE